MASKNKRRRETMRDTTMGTETELYVAEVFRYTPDEDQFQSAVIHGADYPRYMVEPLKRFRNEKEAEEYAQTLKLCGQPEPGGIARVIVRPMRDDWDSADRFFFSGMVGVLGTKETPWR